MTIFQLILFISAMVIFYLFFKKLFSEDYPKRGVDFEAKNADEQIGGISRPEKIFSRPTAKPNRIDELTAIADESVEKGDMTEAQKALQSALIIDENNPDILSRYAYVLNATNNHTAAKEEYQKLLEVTPEDDMAEAALGNICHQLGDDEAAIMHHSRSIELDPQYAPHYYNYANTLYDLGKSQDALELYEKAYNIDPTLDQAQEMISKLKEAK
ncbi:MAG: tetratricopeptide repeat protein [Campylobacterota bacterium]|nr:tetratricopeptide repeat protein [Campylobacterota bacterium]